MNIVKQILVLLGLLVASTSYAADKTAAFELVFVTSDHCPFCMAWEKEVGRSYDRSPYAKQAPLRRVDLQEIDTLLPDLKPKVIGTPTFLIMDEKIEIGRIQGFSSSEMFYWALSEYITP